MNDEIREPTPSKRALRAAQLTHRYGVDPRTITRWKDTGVEAAAHAGLPQSEARRTIQSGIGRA